MRLISTSILLATLSLAAAAPAWAQTPPRKTTETVYHAMTASDLDALLAAEGYTDVDRVSDKQVNVTAADGFRFTLTQTACEIEGQPAGCLGLSIQATWTLKAGDEAALAPVVAAFNVDLPIAKALMFSDYIMLERYVITDGGVTLRHVASEIGEYLTLTEIFEQRMAEVLD